jgi:hypothetical protein
MPNYNLTIDLAPLMMAMASVNKEIELRIAKTVADTANAVLMDWKERVLHAPGVWQQEKDDYANSIAIRPINDFEVEIYSDYKFAAEIETGRPARDLKRMLDTSTKVRVSVKTSQRYLIIPMRHNVSSMPQAVKSAAQAMTKSTVTSMTTRPNQIDTYDTKSRQKIGVSQRVYQWGSRMAAPKGSNHAGMVRMNTSTGKAKSSSYLTFRVMTENSNGWIIPAKPGLFIVRTLVDEYLPKFEQQMGTIFDGLN